MWLLSKGWGCAETVLRSSQGGGAAKARQPQGCWDEEGRSAGQVQERVLAYDGASTLSRGNSCCCWFVRRLHVCGQCARVGLQDLGGHVSTHAHKLTGAG